jgi:hypothetical protein
VWFALGCRLKRCGEKDVSDAVAATVPAKNRAAKDAVLIVI